MYIYIYIYTYVYSYIHIPKKRLMHFNTLTGRFNHFICIQEEFPHPLNGC